MDGNKKKTNTQRTLIGWREWVSFPELNIQAIKAKIDTGARTSALHAYDLELYRKQGKIMVRFCVQPIQRNARKVVSCHARVHDIKTVKNSGGATQDRITILTKMKIGQLIQLIEVTLTNRDEMGFRMLLGRTAVRDLFLIHPGKSFLLGKNENSYSL